MTGLSSEAIHQAMDTACAIAQQKNLELAESSFILEPVKNKNQCDDDDDADNSTTIGQCYSLVLKAADLAAIYGTVSFYVAYSSWEGPELFITELDLDESHTDKKSAILYTMAEVAVSLKCARLVWQTLDSDEEDRKLYNKLGAETLQGVLTLCLKRSKMIDFLATRTTQQTEPRTLDNKSGSPVQLTVEAIHEAIDSSLIPTNATLEPNNLRLRRATRSDVDSILGLVQGLADFVKESDSVKITLDQYLQDGFGKAPLFHCILVEDVTDHPSAVIGMAFFFFGVAKKYGRFLYLEDLFLHQDSRGRGGGKQLMYTLSDVCLKLDCESFVWQALDWNTPSLQFYDKIGAQVQEGVITLRFAGDKLHEFVEKRQVN